MVVINQNIQHKMFVKALDLRELQGSLEQSMQHMEAGFIRGEPGTLAFSYHRSDAR